MESSFRTQVVDCRLRPVYVWSYTNHDTGCDQEFFRTASGGFIQKTEQGPRSPTVRSLILAGALPSPEIGPGLPAQYPDTMEKLLDGIRAGEICTVRETVNSTIDKINYNGLQPFNKTTKQIADGSGFLETRIDSRNEEETGSTCIGMSHALLKQLRDKHGIEGVFAAQRQRGKDALEHASVIVECSDGYVLLDPRSFPNDRIFQVPFNTSVTINGKIFTADKPRSTTPIIETHPGNHKHPEMEFEYCTNISNSDDIIAKHFMMEVPSFPIAAYYLEGHEKAGRGAKTIWVSLLSPMLTFKNDTVTKDDSEKRTEEIPFQEVLESDFSARLERFYKAGKSVALNM